MHCHACLLSMGVGILSHGFIFMLIQQAVLAIAPSLQEYRRNVLLHVFLETASFSLVEEIPGNRTTECMQSILT